MSIIAISDGIVASDKYLSKKEGKWFKQCRICQETKEVNKENFILIGNRMNDRVCRKCRMAKVESVYGETKVCPKCGKTKPATREYFGGYRGYLARMCNGCRSVKDREHYRTYVDRHPRTTWNNLMVGVVRRRAEKQNVPVDIEAVRNLVESFVPGTPCPCCGEPMNIAGVSKDNKRRFPSIDRMIPKTGYVKSNMDHICYSCNNLKSDGRLLDFERLVSYIKRRTNVSKA